MAVVKGVKEKVHLPLYDSISVRSGEQFRTVINTNVLRFFMDVNGKTKLQTNMQAASLLPHWNTFEARALRVVISDLCPVVPELPIELIVEVKGVAVRDGKDNNNAPAPVVTLTKFNPNHLVKLARRVEGSATGSVRLSLAELSALGLVTDPPLTAGIVIITRLELNAAEALFRQTGNGRILPPLAQLFPNNGCGTVIGNFIYNTVTTFFVGEKIMIQTPTWFFPAGAGPYSEDGGVVTHGYPNPQATFRFAEPVMIDAQQNFRVEIEIPEGEVLNDLQRLYGPTFIWVVLDGYMTRDVQ
jgi:hypothetical protein